MKLLSEACEYALRSTVWLAQRPNRKQTVREIAEGTQAAPGYLVKVLQSLTRAGILSAQRGIHGGYELNRDPAGLTVLEVINAVDPIERIHTCPLGLDAHSQHLCPMHKRIDDAIAVIQAGFESSTIQDLLETRSRSLCAALTLEGSPFATNSES